MTKDAWTVTCFFVSDLHGRTPRYRSLFERVLSERPEAVFLGGDLLPMSMDRSWASDASQRDFVTDFLVPEFERLVADLGAGRPEVFLILGNDDAKINEKPILEAQKRGLWRYLHARHRPWSGREVYGYACVPPTPFLLKDWERYDVSRHVDIGCVSPESGHRSVPADPADLRHGTILKDLQIMAGKRNLADAIFLFHSPPYQTMLDRANLDGKSIDHVPLDVHIGSIAISRFIGDKQPLLTLHGHVHESTRLSGDWRDRIGRTHCLQAAHDGPELSLIRFDIQRPEDASRELIPG